MRLKFKHDFIISNGKRRRRRRPYTSISEGEKTHFYEMQLIYIVPYILRIHILCANILRYFFSRLFPQVLALEYVKLEKKTFLIMCIFEKFKLKWQHNFSWYSFTMFYPCFIYRLLCLLWCCWISFQFRKICTTKNSKNVALKIVQIFVLDFQTTYKKGGVEQR